IHGPTRSLLPCTTGSPPDQMRVNRCSERTGGNFSLIVKIGRFVCHNAPNPVDNSVILDVAPGVSGRALEAQQHNTNETWTATKQTSPDNTNPSRTAESHAESGNRSVDIIVGRSFCGGQR